MKKKYTAHFSIESDGRWIGSVPVSKNSGANTHGRTLEQVKERMREALAALLDCEPEAFEIVEEVKLPGQLGKRLEAAQSARTRAETELRKATDKKREAARALLDAGLSLRDVGTLLGISRQGAHKLTA